MVDSPKPPPVNAGAGLERWLLHLGLIFLLAACGSDGGSGPSNAPTISNLRVSYTPPSPGPGTVTQVQFIVDVVDPDGDWVLGRCRFVTGNQVELPIQTVAGVPANAPSGTATCVLVEVFADDTVQVDLTVVDQAGHQSNVLSALVTLEGEQARRE